ncbi:MAG: hypothetical protein CMJ21_00160 [Phycisphaerae bacterium]|nr:hypothetical protein [Phycisphaerae bacterium]
MSSRPYCCHWQNVSFGQPGDGFNAKRDRRGQVNRSIVPVSDCTPDGRAVSAGSQIAHKWPCTANRWADVVQALSDRIAV